MSLVRVEQVPKANLPILAIGLARARKAPKITQAHLSEVIRTDDSEFTIRINISFILAKVEFRFLALLYTVP